MLTILFNQFAIATSASLAQPFDYLLAYSYPPGVNPEQVLAYDPVNHTMIVSDEDGIVAGWKIGLQSQASVQKILMQPDMVAYINSLGYMPVSVVVVN